MMGDSEGWSTLFFAVPVQMIVMASLILLSLACVWLAWIDLRDGIIPDWLNLLVAATGVVRMAALADWTTVVTVLGEGVLIGAAVWLLRWLYFKWRKVRDLDLATSSCLQLPPSGSVLQAYRCNFLSHQSPRSRRPASCNCRSGR
jgi:hypothetical protein